MPYIIGHGNKNQKHGIKFTLVKIFVHFSKPTVVKIEVVDIYTYKETDSTQASKGRWSIHLFLTSHDYPCAGITIAIMS